MRLLLENVSGEELQAAQAIIKQIFNVNKGSLKKIEYSDLVKNGYLDAETIPVEAAKSIVDILSTYIKQAPHVYNADPYPDIRDELNDIVNQSSASPSAPSQTVSALTPTTTPPPNSSPAATASTISQTSSTKPLPQKQIADPLRDVEIIDDKNKKDEYVLRNGKFKIKFPTPSKSEIDLLPFIEIGKKAANERLAREEKQFSDRTKHNMEIEKLFSVQRYKRSDYGILEVHSSILQPFVHAAIDSEVFKSRRYRFTTKSGVKINRAFLEKSAKVLGHETKSGKVVPPELRAGNFVKPTQKNSILAVGLPTNNVSRIKIPSFHKAENDREQKIYNELRKAIMIIFADKRDDMSLDPVNSSAKKEKEDDYIISGTRNQYHKFIILAKQLGFDVSQLQKVYEDKLAGGGLTKHEEIEGHLNDAESFKNSIQDKFPNLELNLYKEQKDGIAFLFSRKKAVLGDAAGAGKTIQLTLAASLVLEKYGGGKVLIVCLKNLVEQWIKNLEEYLGPEVKSEISTDLMNPKKWTIVNYDQFSAKDVKIDPKLEKIEQTDYKIVIFDELHKLKKDTTKWSIRLAAATKKIPVKWGATATIAANTPKDVQNQIAMIGHSLGFIPPKQFAREFAPEKLGKKGTTGSPYADRVKAAENLNKWLHIAGIYIRRNKEDLREMPGLTVGAKKVQTDNEYYADLLQKKIDGLKVNAITGKPNPLSVLGAQRYAMAMSKVPRTVEEAMHTIYQGKKVLIFTCFKDTGDAIVEQLRQKVEGLDPNFAVISYTSNTKPKDRKLAKERFMADGPVDIDGTKKLIKALVMSIKMGGTGLSFPNTAEKMIVNDFDWTPEAAEQSEGRLYRINSEKPVEVQYVLSENDLDKILYQTLRRKRELAKTIQAYRVDLRDATTTDQEEIIMSKIIDAYEAIKKADEEAMQASAVAMRNAKRNVKESWTFKNFFDFIENIPSLESLCDDLEYVSEDSDY
jgi:superfamily II DNA or RNA helicase